MRRFLSALIVSSCLIAASLVFPAGPLGAPLLAVVAQQAGSQPGGPVAAFSVTNAGPAGPNVRVHDLLNFDATPSQGSGLVYQWNFGDGSPPATGAKVSHAFSQVDDYSVTLNLVDSAGRNASVSQSIRVIPLVDSLVSNPPLQQVMIGAVVPVLLYVQAPGPDSVSASLSGDLLSSKPVQFSTPDVLSYATLSAQVANERNNTIDQQIIQKPGGSVPLQGNVGLELDYQTSAGKSVQLNLPMSLQKDRDPSKGTWAITYPNFSLITGTTDPSAPDVDGFYMKGDPGFHHPDDPLVRKYALQAARGGDTLSDDPAQVMENIYTFTGGLFGSDDPAQIEPDNVIVRKIADGELVPGQQDEKYICISQTYFLSSLARTLGLPSRELTIALANPVSQDASGAWTVTYVQEGATEVWFNQDWHLYDTWLRIRNLDDYLIRKYAYQAWYSYSAQNYNLVAKNGDPLNLYGHNFAIGEDEGTPADPTQWYLRKASERSGVTVVNFPTS